MQINENTVEALAHLARLEFEKDSKKEMVKDMSRILSFVETLNKLDTEGVEPLVYMNEDTNVLREDEMKQTLSQQEALKNAPKKDSDYFKAPKVLESKNLGNK